MAPAAPERQRRWFRRRPRRPSARISLRRRRKLERLGRADGAAGLPDTDTDAPVVTTDVRRALRNQLNADRAALWEAFHVEHTERTVELAELATRLDLAREAAQAASEALAAAQRRTPGAEAARPRRGETAHARPEELVAQRRRRRHERETAMLAARRDATQRAVRDLERREAFVIELDAGRRRTVVAEEHRLIGMHLAERAIYDRALVRSHGDRDEVGALLDRTPPTLSGWARAASADADGGRAS